MYSDNCCVAASPINGVSIGLTVDKGPMAIPPNACGMCCDTDRTLIECQEVVFSLLQTLALSGEMPKLPEPQCLMQQLQNTFDRSKGLLDMLKRLQELIGG